MRPFHLLHAKRLCSDRRLIGILGADDDARQAVDGDLAQRRAHGIGRQQCPALLAGGAARCILEGCGHRCIGKDVHQPTSEMAEILDMAVYTEDNLGC